MTDRRRVIHGLFALVGIGVVVAALWAALMANSPRAGADPDGNSGSAAPSSGSSHDSGPRSSPASAGSPRTPAATQSTRAGRPGTDGGRPGAASSDPIASLHVDAPALTSTPALTKTPASSPYSPPTSVAAKLTGPTAVGDSAVNPIVTVVISRPGDAPPLELAADTTAPASSGSSAAPGLPTVSRTPRTPGSADLVAPRPVTSARLDAVASSATISGPAVGTTAAELSPAAVKTSAVVDDAAVAASSPELAVTLPTPSIAAVTNPAGTPSLPMPVYTVGSLILNLVIGLIQTFAGPPVLPPGSTVTVRTSSLTLPDIGQTVTADWYFPNNGDTPTRLIYFQHGFLAASSMYSYTAATLAEETNSIVVAPNITSNFLDPSAEWLCGTPMYQAVADLFVGNRAALTESASAAAGHPVTLPTNFVLAGHSGGGDLVMGAAGDMVDNGAIRSLAGVLLLDSVDLNNTVPAALRKLTGPNYRPVYDISSERYEWNMYGLVGDELQAARPGRFNGVVLAGGRHIDALQGGNAILQFAEYVVAGFSQPQNIEAVKTLAVGWVNDMFAHTHNGIYGTPQQSIEISTPAGTATATVLPFTSSQPVNATPWDALSAAILDVIIRIAVYDPLPGQSSAVTL